MQGADEEGTGGEEERRGSAEHVNECDSFRDNRLEVEREASTAAQVPVGKHGSCA